MKKILSFLLIFVFLFGMTGCGKKQDIIEGKLEDIMSVVYGDIKDGLPAYLENIEINDENIEMYLGTKDLDYKEALANESMISSVAHSVVLVRMNHIEDVEKAKETIREKINPRKWVCVWAENVIVESRGDLILVVLNDEVGEDLLKNFQEMDNKID